MTDIRFECLRLAVEAKASDPVAEALRYLSFINGDPVPQSDTPRKCPEDTSDQRGMRR